MRYWRTAISIGSLLFVGACAQNDTSSDASKDALLGPSRVATVNGRPVAESVLRTYALATERKNLEELTPETRERLLNDLIGVELLAQEGEKDGTASSRAVAAQLELQRLQLVGRAVATSYLQKNPATEAELQRVYDDNLPRLTSRQFKARHILVETKTEADGVIAQLRQGRDFIALAQEHADGLTGPNGGALDWFTADSMPAPFAAAVRSMSVGAYSSEPVQTEYGFHVILLEDAREQEPPPLAEVRNELVAAVERKRVEDYLKSLRESATVEVGR